MIKPDEIIRSNRKTLSLSIDFFGRLIVRAPKRYSEERIFSFIRQKEGWILRKKAQMARAGVQLPPENLDGYHLPFLGGVCPICLTEEKICRFSQDPIRLYLPKINSQKHLKKWLKESAESLLFPLAQRAAAAMGVSYTSLAISSAKTRWGSCTADNKIRFTFRLVYAPAEVMKYVVVHELAHIKHKNHSAAFWAEVAKFCPTWRAHRVWLRVHGALMEIL